MLVSFKNILDEAVKIIVNFIKYLPLNTCFLIILYAEMGIMYKVCYITEEKWLSCGKTPAQLNCKLD